MVATDSLNVLETTPPRFTPEEVAAIAAELFGIEGEARDLGSERDQTFLVGDGVAGQDLQHRRGSGDPRPRGEGARAHRARRPRAADRAPRRPAGLRRAPKGHFVRLFERMPGRSGARGSRRRRSPRLRGHERAAHARAARVLPPGGRARSPLESGAGGAAPTPRRVDPRSRPAADRRARRSTATRSASVRAGTACPAQVVHGDFTLDNVLVDERGRVSGITDFGDLGFGTRAGDLAIDLCSMLRVGARGALPHRADRHRRLPVADSRSRPTSSTSSATSSPPGWRRWSPSAPGAWSAIPRTPSTSSPGTTSRGRCSSSSTTLGFDDVAHELGATRVAATGELAPAAQPGARLGAHAGSRTGSRCTSSAARASGCSTREGRRLLDCYNNVPVVGHCHPRVTEAVVRQTRS